MMLMAIFNFAGPNRARKNLSQKETMLDSELFLIG